MNIRDVKDLLKNLSGAMDPLPPEGFLCADVSDYPLRRLAEEGEGIDGLFCKGGRVYAILLEVRHECP